MNLTAALADAPGIAETAVISDGEYANVHSIPAGSLPAGDVTERFSDTVLPGDATADDRARVSV